MKPTEHDTKKTPVAATGFFAMLAGLLAARGTGARAALLVPVLALVCLACGVGSAQAAVIHEYIREEKSSEYTPFNPVGEVAVDESTSLSDWAKGDTYEVVGGNPATGRLGNAVDVFKPVAGGGREQVAELTLPLVGPSSNGVYLEDVAVNDVNGDVIVSGQNGRDELALFEPTLFGEYAPAVDLAARVPAGTSDLPGTFTVDQGDGEIYMVENQAGESVVDEFNSIGTYLGRFTAAETPLGHFSEGGISLSADPTSHEVYVDDELDSAVEVFGPDVVVPDVTTGAVSHLGGTSTSLSGTVDPDGAGEATCSFIYGSSASELTKTAECKGQGSNAMPISNGTSNVAVDAKLEDLKPDTEYCYRLQASNEQGGKRRTNQGDAAQDRCFTTPGPADVEASIFAVTADSATFQLTIDPDGVPASYYFQYSTASTEDCTPSTCERAPLAADAPLGSGESDVTVEQPIQEKLLPGTVYHYRAVVVREVERGQTEEFAGPDQIFTTQGAGTAFALPDDRQWEQVSPPDKHGTLFERSNGDGGIPGAGLGSEQSTGLPIQASVAGNAIATLTSQPSESEPQGYENPVSVMSTRGAAGWSSQVIAPPHSEPAGPTGNSASGSHGEYRLFSDDLSQAIVQTTGATLLSPLASEPTPYLRTDYSGGDVSAHCEGSYLTSSSCFTPLVTGKEGYANVPAGTAPFGEASEGRCRSAGAEHAETYTCGPRFLDATPDLSHVVLSAGTQLTSTPDEPEIQPDIGRLYEWGDGRLQPLYLLPAGEGGTGVYAGGFNADRPVSHQLSDDGSVFFNYNGHLYLHDFAKEASVRLVAGERAAEFLYASADGSKVLFRDEEQLTSVPGGGVYECRIVDDACGELLLTGLPSSLTAGELIGGSEDASYLYFRMGGTHLKQGNGFEYVDGGRLEVAHYEDGDWTATEGMVLPESQEGKPVEASHRISPNGRWFAFMSSADLTGYDTADANSGQPDSEVYLYDAATGRTSCASCNPTGARPVGVNVEEGDWIAAGVPEWATASAGPEGAQGGGGISVYQPRYLSNSGRLFFDSNDALVPQDVNGTWDVYEYEPWGVGGCTEGTSSGSVVQATAAGGAPAGGCVGLISSGTSPEESTFLDASESGGDVFFLTESQLVSTDTDTAPDVYDAHECTSESPCIPPPAAHPPPCETEAACKAAPTPQPSIYGAPASATFNGPGNVTSTASPPASKAVTKKTVKCKKGFVKNKKNRCVPKKKSKKAKKAQRAGADRRAKR